MALHNELGAWGEEMAMQHLVRLGFAIAERNVKIGKYELDIIATKDDIIAFVEVKTRSDNFVDPTDAIDEKKIKHMARAADAYIQSRGILANPQFDVITVVGTPGGEFELTHYPDAFFPPLLAY